MNYELKTDNWRLGELVSPKWNYELIKKDGQKSYAYYAVSDYICVREATDGQCGIPLKILGKTSKKHIMFVNGKPFCKDEREDLFKGMHYYSYPFPTASALKEVLEIVGSDEVLKERLKAESMSFNPLSTFWIRETAGNLPSKKPQYYDATSGLLCKAND